jgi:hypothetical protein
MWVDRFSVIGRSLQYCEVRGEEGLYVEDNEQNAAA